MRACVCVGVMYSLLSCCSRVRSLNMQLESFLQKSRRPIAVFHGVLSCFDSFLAPFTVAFAKYRILSRGQVAECSGVRDVSGWALTCRFAGEGLGGSEGTPASSVMWKSQIVRTIVVHGACKVFIGETRPVVCVALRCKSRRSRPHSAVNQISIDLLSRPAAS